MWDLSLGSFLLGCATGVILCPIFLRWLIRIDREIQFRRMQRMFDRPKGNGFVVYSGKAKP